MEWLEEHVRVQQGGHLCSNVFRICQLGDGVRKSFYTLGSQLQKLPTINIFIV